MFVLFLLTIVLSVLLRFTASDYPFGIFKPWLRFRLLCNIYLMLQMSASCFTAITHARCSDCCMCSKCPRRSMCARPNYLWYTYNDRYVFNAFFDKFMCTCSYFLISKIEICRVYFSVCSFRWTINIKYILR